jgi:phosphoribosylanthranilate isomerase
VHDWSVSAAFVEASPRPVFLAGGPTAANVGEAIRRVRPFGLDLCSGVGTDGWLDKAKLAAFVEAARAADRGLDARRGPDAP